MVGRGISLRRCVMLDPEMFLIREEGSLRLITPQHGIEGLSNSVWTPSTAMYRSRVESIYGATVSQGFKKFFNLGQGPVGLQVTADDVIKACEQKDAIATLKIDGSLLIRSCYQGEVLCRTRGSFGYEHLGNAYEMIGFEYKYPRVFDPSLYPNVSLLFEWTSPANQIVLKYDEEDLTLIGGINHYSMNYLPMEELEDIAKDLAVPLVEWFPLTGALWGVMNEEMAVRPDIEGYVIRLDEEQRLVKVKAASYLTRHALKSNLDTEKLCDLYFQLGQPPFKEFCAHFKAAFDEEVLIWAMGAISNLYDGVKVFQKIIDHMKKSAEVRATFSRKDAAIAGLAEYGQTKRFHLYMNYWERKEPSRDLLKSVLLQNTKQVEISMFHFPEREGTGGGDALEGRTESKDVRLDRDRMGLDPDSDGYGWGI
jgi:RNA ligase